MTKKLLNLCLVVLVLTFSSSEAMMAARIAMLGVQSANKERLALHELLAVQRLAHDVQRTQKSLNTSSLNSASLLTRLLHAKRSDLVIQHDHLDRSSQLLLQRNAFSMLNAFSLAKKWDNLNILQPSIQRRFFANQAPRQLQQLPVDKSNFRTIIESNNVYVDKTEQIHALYATGGRFHFLARLRRSGKSLLISTLFELYSGNKELFNNLWIGQEGRWDWTKKSPIIHLDFSTMNASSAVHFEECIVDRLNMIANEYGLEIQNKRDAQSALFWLVTQLGKKTKCQVVVLIDEYDKPILDALVDNEKELARQNKGVLKRLFDPLKGLDAIGLLRAIFITGVTKFSKTSLFSGLNNLNDITMKPIAADLLGYTKDEIKRYFGPHIQDFALQSGQSEEEIMKDLEKWYNGYRFSTKDVKVYNPFSLLYCLQEKKIENYWYESGTPTFLLELLKKNYVSLVGIEKQSMRKEDLGTFDVDYIPMVPLLFQTGYLTISSHKIEDQEDFFTLNFPNEEVKKSFQRQLFRAISNANDAEINNFIPQLKEALKSEDLEKYVSLMQGMIAWTPYNLHIPQEKYYQSLFLAAAKLTGFKSEAEVLTSRGRIDLVIELDDKIYIFEFKFNKAPREALDQIIRKSYMEKYQLSEVKKVIPVGLSFIYEDKKLTFEYMSN